MFLKTALTKLIAYQNLSHDEMTGVMQEIMTGQVTPAQIGGFLVGLEMKSPTIEEIMAAIQVMRQMAKPVFLSGDIIDIVGTGGDGAQTFNISTTCAFVIAAAGGKVAKHGNRSVSSSSGSADVLEQAGINLELSYNQVATCVNQIGIGFLFAPLYHPALKFASAPRKELAIRTLFNLLGPLANPANASHIVLGVYAKKWLTLIAQVLLKLNCKRALVVHSEDGLDEISISAATDIVDLNQGKIKQYQLHPQEFGFQLQSREDLCVNSPAQSYQILLSVLNNIPGSARDIVLLNSGAAIYNAGLTTTIAQGISEAQRVLANGTALEKLTQLITLSKTFKGHE